MDLLNTIMIAASGLRAQSGRMRVISENLANASSTAQQPGGDPYRRRISTFQSEFDRELGAYTVKLGRINFDDKPFETRHEPGHPAADASGYVKLPNINPLIEMMDIREAQRSYEANLNVVQSARTMAMRTVDILRS
jgi:flagellar basal-body rod protein FlgC